VGLVGDELEAGSGPNGSTELGSISVPPSDIEAAGWKQLSGIKYSPSRKRYLPLESCPPHRA
jgi:hypothetical protein